MDRVLSRIFGHKREYQEAGETHIMRNRMICIPHLVVVVENPEGKTAHGRNWHSWEDVNTRTG
jgi:hypothetical protein